MDPLLAGVTWFRRSAVRVRRAGVVVHVDPRDIAEPEISDFILLTHPHFDSFSEIDVERVRGPQTVIVAPASMKKQIEQADHFMRAGDMVQLDGLDLLAVPAYNIDKRYHPREAGWLGYVFTVAGVTYYHAGDTDVLPSMAGIRCDVAFLPCEGGYTMDGEAAAATALACGASVLVPIHWGDGAGGLARAEQAVEAFAGEGRILRPGQEAV